MKTLIIDRFEGTFAICENKDQKMFGIEVNELPRGVKEGDVLDISDDGVITVNREKTDARRAKIKKMQDKLWE